MNKSKGKKAGKICENILFVIGILGIAILYWYDKSTTLDPNIKESYPVNIHVTSVRSMKMIYPTKSTIQPWKKP